MKIVVIGGSGLIGPWLPEPVDTSADPALGAERAEALELAVLLLLEKLSPTERAAYVLREAFDYSHRQVAEVLGTSEANARQLGSRARTHLGAERSSPAGRAEQRRLVVAFLDAARNGELAALERLLADGVVVRSDGGGGAYAARKEVHGRARVTNYLDNVLRNTGAPPPSGLSRRTVRARCSWPADDGTPLALMALDVSERGVERVLIVVNPDKLRSFAPA